RRRRAPPRRPVRPVRRSTAAPPPDTAGARVWESRSWRGSSSGQSRFASMVLFLHNRYRTTGGEERVVEDLMWLVRERLREPVELLSRSSASLGRGGAALGLLRGGLKPAEVARAVEANGARVVHAHNLQPALGW